MIHPTDFSVVVLFNLSPKLLPIAYFLLETYALLKYTKKIVVITWENLLSWNLANAVAPIECQTHEPVELIK